jgi:hypothetical protein
MSEELDEDVRIGLASYLRDVADDIQAAETFGEVTLDRDVQTERACSLTPVLTVRSETVEADIKTERFDVEVTIRNSEPE